MSYGNNGEYSMGCCGILRALLIVAFALVFSIGAILGAIFFGIVLSNLVVFIAFAVIMLVLLILLLIVRSCRNCSCM